MATRTTIPQDRDHRYLLGQRRTSDRIGSGGLTGVWAEENTRESLFRRDETQGNLRHLGNSHQGSHVCWLELSQGHDQAGRLGEGRLRGRCAQGGDYSAGRSNRSDAVVHAIKDPDSGNLDRIQIIKISTKNGKSQEKIYDVVWSGDRKPDPKTGKVPAVGNTVDIKAATYTNSIGATELIGEWTDPSFDPKAYTTYYARVLEIPTPRWSTYWAAELNLPPNPNVAEPCSSAPGHRRFGTLRPTQLNRHYFCPLRL